MQPLQLTSDPMFQLFLISTKRFLGLALHALTRSPEGVAPLRPRRVLVMLLFLPIFGLVQLIHWLGFLLDDLLFRGWRRVEVQRPVFVLGVPRSGTTRMHQVLARDRQFTTFRTWECLFAPSVTQRRFWMTLARIDAAVGRPFGRLLGWLERRVFAGLDDVHAMSLDTPEEDYFALMPILSCFILALPFPGFEHIWRIGQFDRDLPEDERRLILGYYQDCLKRHLYVHGSDRVLLSKNAAFAPMAQGLADTFPDARFIVCLRDPRETIPSQLSSIAEGLAFFGVPPDSAPIRARLVDQLAFYYENLDQLQQRLPPERHATLGMSELRAGLAPTLTRIYQQLGLTLSPAFAEALGAEDGHARRYRSRHCYSLEQFGFDADGIAERFAVAYRHPALSAFAPTASVGPDDAGAAARELAARPMAPPIATEATSC